MVRWLVGLFIDVLLVEFSEGLPGLEPDVIPYILHFSCVLPLHYTSKSAEESNLGSHPPKGKLIAVSKNAQVELAPCSRRLLRQRRESNSGAQRAMV